MNIVIAILGVVLVALIALIVILVVGNKDDDDDDTRAKNETTEVLTETETETEATEAETTEAETEATEAETTEATTEASTETTTEASPETITYDTDSDIVRSKFGISTGTSEDYANNLDPDQYLYYDSGIGDFKFSYPANLFNEVYYDDRGATTVYGTNLETIKFAGSDGAELTYAVFSRTDGKSIEDFTNEINDYEHSNNYEVSDILVSPDGEHGRIVLSCVVDSQREWVLYDLITVDDDYVYRMASKKRNFTSEDDKNQYSYVTENEYRLCGFSGSTYSPRTYEEYLNGE